MQIQIISLSPQEIAQKMIHSWPIWEKEISVFPWTYDTEEHCLILEGDIYVTTNKETVHIIPGNYVIFPAGLQCKWDIRKPVKKHYQFI